MKKIYTFFIFTLLLLRSPAQFKAEYIIENPPASPWNFYSEKIKACSDGGVVYVKAAAPGSFMLVKTDSLFNLQWAKDLNNIPSTAVIMDAGELPGNNGYFVYAADNNNGTATNESELIITTDNAGNVVWSNNYTVSFSGIYAPSRVRFFPTGEILLVISTYGYAGYIILNPNGSAVKGEGIKADSAEFKNPGFDGWVLDDSLFVLTSKSNSDNHIATLSKTGTVKWANRYIFPGTYHQARTVRKTADGNILVAGLYQDSTTSAGGGYMMKLDMNGNFLWRKVYASSLFSSIGFNYIYEKANGNVVVKDIYNLLLTETDANGNVIISKIVDANNVTMDISTPRFVATGNKFESVSGGYVPSFHRNDDGMNNECLYISYHGVYMSAPAATPAVIPCIYRFPLLNSSADAGITSSASSYSYTLNSACLEVGTEESNMANNPPVFPNPANDNFSLTLHQFNAGETITVTVYDVNGKPVSAPFTLSYASTVHLSSASLASGFYLVKAQQGNKFNVQKLIVQH